MLLYFTSKTVKQLQKTYSSIIHTPKSGVFHTCLPLHITFLPFQSYLNKFNEYLFDHAHDLFTALSRDRL